jgi:uncharacterized cupredoxin-like copper-binding protein
VPSHPLVPIALVAWLLVSCGGAPPSRPPSTPGTAGQPRDVNVILKDYAFIPTPLELHAGETVRFHLINGGLITHEFVLGGRDVQQAWASAEAGATPPIIGATAPPVSVPPDLAGLRILLRSGEQATVEYQVPRDERLELACHIAGHVAEGMVGQVVVREGPAGR